MNGKWDVLNLSVLRNPILSLDYFYQNILSQKQSDKIVELVLSDETIKEALYFANHKFMLELEQYHLKSEKKKRKILHTLLKYLARMASKTAPFGLFSSISEVDFTDSEIEDFKGIEYMKHISVDLQWLNGVIIRLEQDSAIFENLDLKFNDLCIKEGERIYFPYRSQYGQSNNIRNSYNEGNGFTFSISSSELLNFIENISTKEIPSKDLIMIIKSNYPELEIKDIRLYLKKLIEIEVLTTNLRPDLRTKNHLERILIFFERHNLTYHNIYIKLKEISKLICKYRNLNLPHKKSQMIFSELKQSMLELDESPNVIQIDLKASGKKVSSKVKFDLQESMDIIRLFSVPIYGASDLNGFVNAFVRKYGFYNKISLIHLLYSDDFGAPENYNFPKGNIGENLEIDIENNKNYRFILSLIRKAALKNKEEVIIDKKIVHSLEIENKIQQSEYVESFDMLFSLVKNGNNNYMTLNNEIITKNGGQLVGRFAYLLSDKFNNELDKLNEFEKKLYGEKYQLAEITCQGLYGRSANISTSSKMRDFVIPIMNSAGSSAHEVKLSSLSCHVNSTGSFVITNKENDKIVKVKLSSMLHGLFNYPNIYRFLVAIEGQNKYHLSSIFPLIQKTLKLPYLPRVRFKNIILNKRAWTIDLDLLGVSKGESSNEIMNKVKQWKQDFNVPNIVELKENDATLMINLNNDLYIEFLVKEIMKKNEVVVVELDFGLDEDVISNEKNIYKSELSITTLNLLSKIEDERLPVESTDNSIALSPGDEYIYYKIYIRPDYQNKFLYEYVHPYMLALQNEGIVKDYFFVRYVDKFYHIRLRIRFEKNKGHLLFLRLSDFLKRFINSKLISNISINTYFPETHRYGGEKIFSHIHDYFYADSKLVIELLKLMDLKDIKLDVVIFYTINQILDSFKIREENKSMFLEKYLGLYGHPMNTKYSRSLVENYSLDFTISNLIKRTSTNLSILNEIIGDSNFSDEKKEEIIFSIIHMHFNRIMENIDREKELQLINSILDIIKEDKVIN